MAENAEQAAMKKQREDQAKLNAEVMAKEAGYRPTPTVEEIQTGMVGGNIDDKEPDGSAEQNVHHVTTPVQTQIEVGHKVAEAKPANEKAGYSTRAATPENKPKT